MTSASIPKVMRAVRVHKFGGIGALQIDKDVPVRLPAPSEVLVKVKYTGINPVETYMRSGTYTFIPKLPWIPGSEASGTVEALGCDVKAPLKVGQKVFLTGRNNTGAYAEYVTAKEEYVYSLGERLSYAQGAALGIAYFTAYKALILKAIVQPGEKVLIHGASGGVGTALVQIARNLGTTVVGTAGTREGMGVVTKCGAHHVFCHRQEGYEKKMAKSVGEKFDVIIEQLANVNLGRDMTMLNQGARIIIVGCRGPIEINPRLLMAPEASIKGMSLGTASLDTYKTIGKGIEKGINDGWINPVIHSEYDMENIQKAHQDIIESKGAKGKLVMKI